jgi:cell division inhibitor SulA
MNTLCSPVKAKEVQTGITELVIANTKDQYQLWLLPMIAHLSQLENDRWLTWINPSAIDKQALITFGANLERIRLIHLSPTQTKLWAIWEAMSAGNSHTVVASPGVISDKQLKHLEQAANKGLCQGLLLRFR